MPRNNINLFYEILKIVTLFLIIVLSFSCKDNDVDCDSDNDGCVDMFDDFPEDSRYTTDSDGDGLADSNPEEVDADGDGLIDFDKHPYGIDSVLTLKEPCSGHYGDDDCDGIF